jgi:hypothetical protein
MDFLFLGRAFGHFKNLIKIMEISAKKLIKLLKRGQSSSFLDNPEMAFH